ncbi:hypothetical protein K502DRAFT_346453 [Neoconidiobolus thromboides FSU 785]|nr:hypothetical protein K502DRAFT_346453 [Neoconidiobolus thromboides FSU 785]
MIKGHNAVLLIIKQILLLINHNLLNQLIMNIKLLTLFIGTIFAAPAIMQDGDALGVTKALDTVTKGLGKHKDTTPAPPVVNPPAANPPVVTPPATTPPTVAPPAAAPPAVKP